MASRVAAASDPSVAQAATNGLLVGNAVDAVVAAVLVAAAESPGVFLGPLQVLVGGGGSGLTAIDGRARQPGLGIPRPRGAADPATSKSVAAVSAPGLPAALATLLAFAGSASLRRLTSPAVKVARELSPERAETLAAYGRRGVPALTSDAVYDELSAAAGRAVGGALTKDDLAAVSPALVAALPGEDGWVRTPWQAEGGDAPVEVVAATDGGGLVCIACYEKGEGGVAIPALGLLAPTSGAPVLRGQPRVRPGLPRPSACPLALHVAEGLVDRALGLGRTHAPAAALEALIRRLDVSTLARDALVDAPGQPVLLARGRSDATVLASAPPSS